MTLIAVATVGMIWLVAVPTGPEVCNLTYPGPRNCFISDRLGAAVVSTVVLGLAYVLVLVTSVAFSRRRQWVVEAGVFLLLLAAIAAFVSVAWIPALA